MFPDIKSFLVAISNNIHTTAYTIYMTVYKNKLHVNYLFQIAVSIKVSVPLPLSYLLGPTSDQRLLNLRWDVYIGLGTGDCRSAICPILALCIERPFFFLVFRFKDVIFVSSPVNVFEH